MTKYPEQSSYLDDLPAIYQPDPQHPGNVVGQFLLAFEGILTGFGHPSAPGVEELLAGIGPATPGGEPQLRGIQRYFDPGAPPPDAAADDPALDRQRAPAEFLGWLAGWVALSLREDWTEEQKRRFIANIIPLYQKRGTLEAMREVLVAYTGNQAIHVEDFPDLPNYFQVKLSLGISQAPMAPIPNLRRIVERQQQIATAVVEQEKPAHAAYQLRFTGIPTMQVGARSTVGIDTWLGARIASAAVTPTPTADTIQVGVHSTVGVDTTLGSVSNQ
jgi:phage tail-like protein